MLAPSSSMMLSFLNPVESLSDFTFISMLFESDMAMLPVLPFPGTPKSEPENGEYCSSVTLP